MLIGKETNERKNRYAKLNRGRKRRFVSIKKLTARGKEEQEKQRNKCRKNNNRFKKLALKKEREKRKTAQNCKSPMERQMFITTVCKKCD